MLDKGTKKFIVSIFPEYDTATVEIKFTDGIFPLCTVEKLGDDFKLVFPGQALQDYIIDWKTYVALIKILDDVYYKLQVGGKK